MTWPFSTTASSASRAVPQRCCRRRSTAPPRTTWRSGGSCRGATPWVPRLPGDQEKSMVYGEKYIKIWVYHGFNHGLIMKYITMDKHMWGFSWSSGGFFNLWFGESGENLNLTKFLLSSRATPRWKAGGELCEVGKRWRDWERMVWVAGMTDEMWSEGQRIPFSCQENFGSLEELRRSSWEDECGVWTTLTVVLFMNESEIGSGRPW